MTNEKASSFQTDQWEGFQLSDWPIWMLLTVRTSNGKASSTWTCTWCWQTRGRPPSVQTPPLGSGIFRSQTASDAHRACPELPVGFLWPPELPDLYIFFQSWHFLSLRPKLGDFKCSTDPRLISRAGHFRYFLSF